MVLIAWRCPENQRAGLPVVLCQPGDQQVTANQDAVIQSESQGESLSYQVFFQNSDRGVELPNGQGPEVVTAGNETQGGFTTSQGTSTCCGTYCGWVNLQNGGAGFHLNAGQTFTIQLSLSSTMSPLINTANYCAWWRYGGQTNQAG